MKGVFWLGLLFVLSVSVLADPFIAAPVSVNAFRCTSVHDNFSVTNTGSDTTFAVYAEGPAASWVQFPEQGFFLKSGESRTIEQVIDLPCDATSTDVTLVAVDGFGSEDAVVQRVVAKTPINLDLFSLTDREVIYPCGTAKFDLLLVNPLDFEEVYSLAVRPFEKFASFSESKVILAGGEERNLTLEVHPTNCLLSGSFPLEVTVGTEETGLRAALELPLVIRSAGIAEVGKGVKRFSTGFKPGKASVPVRNIGNESAVFSLDLDGAGWALVENASLELRSGQEEKAVIVFRPLNTTVAGDYPLVLTATSDISGVGYSRNFTVRLVPASKQSWWWLGVVIVVILIVAFLVVRKRRKPVPSVPVSVDSQAVRAKERENKKFEQWKRKEQKRMKKKVTADLRAKYTFVSNDAFVPVTKPARSWVWLWVVLLVLILGGLVSASVVWWSFVLTYQAYVMRGVAAAFGIIVVILLVRAAVRARVRVWSSRFANEETSAVLSCWRKGVREIGCVFPGPIQGPLVRIKRGVRLATTAGRHVLEVFSLSANFKGGRADATFAVPKEWLLKNCIEVVDVRLAEVGPGKVVRHTVQKISEDAQFVLFSCNVALDGNYAVVGRSRTREEPKSRGWVWGVLGAACVVALVVLTYLVASPPSVVVPADYRGIPAQAWFADTVHRLNLAQFFKDPDSDALTYSSSAVPHVNISFVNGSAYLQPEKGWAGEGSVVFVADDGKGGVVTSNAVPLVVKKSVIPPIVREYAKPVFAGLVILILLILLVEFRKPVWHFLTKD